MRLAALLAGGPWLPLGALGLWLVLACLTPRLRRRSQARAAWMLAGRGCRSWGF